MSDQDNQPPKGPTVKTSAVPLKKETVRITLRPSAPPSEPLALVAPPPPTAAVPVAPSTLPVAPRVAPGAPTVPLRTPPPAVRPGSATVPIGGPPAPPTGPLSPPSPARPAGSASVPPAPVGSKTIPLAQAPGHRPVTPGTSPTGRLAGAPATQPLPKATMKLTRTEPLSGGAPTAAISSAPIKTAQHDEEDEEEVNEGALNGLSIVALVGALAAVFVALLGWTKVTPFTQPDVKKAEEKEWVSNPKSDWKLPAQYNPFSKESADGSFVNRYNDIKKELHGLPSRGAEK